MVRILLEVHASFAIQSKFAPRPGKLHGEQEPGSVVDEPPRARTVKTELRIDGNVNSVLTLVHEAPFAAEFAIARLRGRAAIIEAYQERHFQLQLNAVSQSVIDVHDRELGVGQVGAHLGRGPHVDLPMPVSWSFR